MHTVLRNVVSIVGSIHNIGILEDAGVVEPLYLFTLAISIIQQIPIYLHSPISPTISSTACKLRSLCRWYQSPYSTTVSFNTGKLFTQLAPYSTFLGLKFGVRGILYSLNKCRCLSATCGGPAFIVGYNSTSACGAIGATVKKNGMSLSFSCLSASS